MLQLRLFLRVWWSSVDHRHRSTSSLVLVIYCFRGKQDYCHYPGSENVKLQQIVLLFVVAVCKKSCITVTSWSEHMNNFSTLKKPLQFCFAVFCKAKLFLLCKIHKSILFFFFFSPHSGRRAEPETKASLGSTASLCWLPSSVSRCCRNLKPQQLLSTPLHVNNSSTLNLH